MRDISELFGNDTIFKTGNPQVPLQWVLQAAESSSGTLGASRLDRDTGEPAGSGPRADNSHRISGALQPAGRLGASGHDRDTGEPAGSGSRADKSHRISGASAPGDAFLPQTLLFPQPVALPSRDQEARARRAETPAPSRAVSSSFCMISSEKLCRVLSLTMDSMWARSRIRSRKPTLWPVK